MAAAALLLFGSALLVVALFVGATPLADAAFGLVILGAPVVAAGALLWWIESMGSRGRGDTRHHRKRRKRSANSRFTTSEQAELTPSELNEYASMLGPVTEAAEAAELAEATRAAHRAATTAAAASSFDGLPATLGSVYEQDLPVSKASSGRSSAPAPLAPTPAAQVWSKQPFAPTPAPERAAAAAPVVVTPAAGVSGASAPAAGQRPSPAEAAPSGPLSAELAANPVPERWTEATLQRLPWRRFESLIETLYSQVGFRIRTQPHGHDGGLHIWLYSRHQAGPPVSVVRCEHGRPAPVGVGMLRELSGVMYAQGARRGHYVSSAGYTSEARDYAKRHGIHLLDLQGLVALIKGRGTEQREALWQAAMDSVATAG